MNDKIATDTNGFTRDGQDTVVLRSKSRAYVIGPSGIGVQHGQTERRLNWHEIAILHRIVGRKVGRAKLEFVARQTPPNWLPMFVLEHIPLNWLTTVIRLDPKLCGTSDATVIQIVRRFAPGIRISTIYRKRTLTGDLDGPDIQPHGTSHGGGDSTGGDGD